MLIDLLSNVKISFKSHLWFTLFVIILRLIPETSDFSYLILAGYALLSRQKIIEALLLSWLFNFLNPVFTPVAENSSFLTNVVIIACFFSILFRANLKNTDKFTILTLGMSFFFIIHGFFFSQVTLISILKVINWTFTILTLYLAWKGMDSLEYENAKKFIKRILSLIVLLSILILQFSKIGFTVNNNYFQGILSHPQAFGMTAAGLCAIFMAQIARQNRATLLSVIMIVICISLTIFSGSRTSLFSLIFSIIILLLLFPLRTIKTLNSVSHFSINKLFLVIVFFFILFACLILSDISITNFIIRFINKADDLTLNNIVINYQISRSILYEPMIANIFENFFTGIGFGIASDPLNMNIKYFKDIPVSAPIEKGNLLLAILEEVGLYGFILFMIWILILFRLVIANSSSDLIVLLTFLLFNLGEAGLFSPKGYGMLYLIVITSVITKPQLIKNIN